MSQFIRPCWKAHATSLANRCRKHLTEDLCPYTCPFIECPRPKLLYISRTAWRDHILGAHSAGQYWECLACAGTETPNTFSGAEEFDSHNRSQHQDTISEDQIRYLQRSCRRIVPPNISQCPLCPWPQNADAVPDATANLEHVGNCILEFSLNALPWADGLHVAGADLPNSDLRQNVPGEYFAESAKESSQVERESLLSDSDLPYIDGTNSDYMSDNDLVESVEDQIAESPQGVRAEFAFILCFWKWHVLTMRRQQRARLLSEG